MKVGYGDGTNVGDGNGTRVGKRVGFGLGDTVGSSVGELLAGVGRIVGCRVGAEVAATPPSHAQHITSDEK